MLHALMIYGATAYHADLLCLFLFPLYASLGGFFRLFQLLRSRKARNLRLLFGFIADALVAG